MDVLGELASRDVNLTRIESRPRRIRLGHYMFVADLEGAASRPPVREALEALGSHVEEVRVLGSYGAFTTDRPPGPRGPGPPLHRPALAAGPLGKLPRSYGSTGERHARGG